MLFEQLSNHKVFQKQTKQEFKNFWQTLDFLNSIPETEHTNKNLNLSTLKLKKNKTVLYTSNFDSIYLLNNRKQIQLKITFANSELIIQCHNRESKFAVEELSLFDNGLVVAQAYNKQIIIDLENNCISYKIQKIYSEQLKITRINIYRFNQRKLLSVYSISSALNSKNKIYRFWGDLNQYIDFDSISSIKRIKPTKLHLNPILKSSKTKSNLNPWTSLNYCITNNIIEKNYLEVL